MIPVPEAVTAFLEAESVAVLATTRRDGSTRQSVVNFVLLGDVVVITTVANRYKVADISRHGMASLCVVGSSSPPRYVTLEGRARVRSAGIAADTEALARRLFGDALDERPMKPAMMLIYGDPPADVLTDEGLAALGRVLIEIEPQRAFGSPVLFR
jgi:PPOX class probable F420-dependent enzyme